MATDARNLDPPSPHRLGESGRVALERGDESRRKCDCESRAPGKRSARDEAVVVEQERVGGEREPTAASRSAETAASEISSQVTSSWPSTGTIGPSQITSIPVDCRKGQTRNTPSAAVPVPKRYGLTRVCA